MEELLRMSMTYCDQHSDEEIKHYCTDYKETICMVYYVSKHNIHKCSDINEFAECFRRVLKVSMDRVVKSVLNNTDELKQLMTNKKALIDKFTTTQASIVQKCAELRSLILLFLKDNYLTLISASI